jgi:ribosomal protein S18 acetylase RimI-like enzyme
MLEGRVIFEGMTAKGLPIVLRYPAGSDIHTLWQFINTLSKERTYILFQDTEISLDDETAWLARKLQAIERSEAVMLCAFTPDGQLMGSSEIDMGSGVRRHIGSFGIALAQEFRGQGVGELLMQTVIDESISRLRNLEIVTLEVFGNNPIGCNLYKKLGFVEYGRLPGGIIHRERAVDSVLMYKVVRESTLR